MTGERKATQAMRILKYIAEHGSISQKEAMQMGIARLAARIHDIEGGGIRFLHEWESGKDADGNCYRYVRYRKAV